jgi:hypothetical protein
MSEQKSPISRWKKADLYIMIPTYTLECVLVLLGLINSGHQKEKEINKYVKTNCIYDGYNVM